MFFSFFIALYLYMLVLFFSSTSDVPHVCVHLVAER